jgi:CRISPR-associated endonuclease/helicase Cas3
MDKANFNAAFNELAGNPPFPWQWDLYKRFLIGNFPAACSLPTGLGKTSVIHLWLLALAQAPEKVPRRLVYVVNRRTVVDQSTREAEKLRANLVKVPAVEAALWELCAVQPSEDEKKANGELRPLAISTLRGQFVDNREWSADPARPAVIAGTVDMIGSRLLFSGYGVGFKLKPLHAGFLGQDVLIVHDEAHLEKPFQDLLEAIECEQRGGRPDFRPMRVMALTATPRGGEEPFELTQEERNPPDVIPNGQNPLHIAWRRLRAKKALTLVPVADERQVVPKIVELAWKRGEEPPDSRVIVFVRKVKAVTEVEKGLRGKKVPAANISTLTGTMRGLERNRQADPRRADADPVFARFLNPPKPDEEAWKVVPKSGTVYLICTAAGEVGVDLSADHLVCDLTPFDSMAQRFGRVNRYGSGDARIDVVYEEKPSEKKKDDPFDQRRWVTLQQLIALHEDASPHAIARLPLDDRIAAFTPTPEVLPVSDILLDAWALTTIRGKLPGRPMVEPYLHGKSKWQPPETHVAWREEVGIIITDSLLDQYKPADLLEDYPLKPHELLRDNSGRVFDRLKKLQAPTDTPVWLVSDDDTVEVTTLAELAKAGKEGIEGKTVLLPPAAGGLQDGMLSEHSQSADDVADELFDEGGRRRVRVWDDEEDTVKVKDMRLVRRIDLSADGVDEDGEGRSWLWFELPADGDTDGSKSNQKPVLWQVHTDDVTKNAETCVAKLPLPQELKETIVLAARLHDLGKQRKLFQTILGNFEYPGTMLAKSGKKGGRVPELYRHEFGSLIDVLDEQQSYCAELRRLSADMQDVVLHLIAVHHGYGRPHFPTDRVFDPEPKGQKVEEIAAAVAQRFARLQRRYGRWGLAYLESLLRAADYAASAKPSRFVEDER